MTTHNKKELQQIVSSHSRDTDFKHFMKLYKEYTKEPYSSLVSEYFLVKMSTSGKIKTIDNKIERNKVQYDLDKQTAKISDLSSGNVSKYGFLNGKDVLLEKVSLEKAATMKRFEYSPLAKELKSQIDITKI